MSENIKLLEFNDKQELAFELADSIAHNLQKSINENGKASLLVSGGSTPKPLFERLSNLQIDWHKVNIALVDERWVSFAHPDSNEKLVRENLLQNKASRAKLISMKLNDDTAKNGQAKCCEI